MFDFQKTSEKLSEMSNERRKSKEFKVVKPGERINGTPIDPDRRYKNHARFNAFSPELMKTTNAKGRGIRGGCAMYYRRVEIDSSGVILKSPDQTNKILAKMIEKTSRTRKRPEKHVEFPKEEPLREVQPKGEELVTGLKQTELELIQQNISNSNNFKQDSDEEEAENSANDNKFFRSKRSNAAVAKKDYVSKEVSSSFQSSNAANFMAGVSIVSNKGKKGRKDKRPVEDDGLEITDEQREQLLLFFDSASAEELCAIEGVNTKTAQTLVKLRPFASISQLMQKLEDTKNMSPGIVQSYIDWVEMRYEVDELLAQCKEISELVMTQVGRLVENCMQMPEESVIEDMEKSILEGDEADVQPFHMLKEQPKILTKELTLKPYQLVGLNWMRFLRHRELNGILADEMGLGKTIQAISFLAHLHEVKDSGPHLVICPSSTLENWKREFDTWCPELKVVLYTGSADKRKAMRQDFYKAKKYDFNVLLTSYSVGTSTLEDRSLMRKIKFDYGVFDEAHMLKNMLTQRYKNLMHFHVKRRLLLTGTPVQNNLLELMSLLTFVMPDLFMSNTDVLNRTFCLQAASRGDKKVDKSSVLVQANEMLKPFCLRRLKADLLCQLQSKTEENIHIPMTELQSKVYNDSLTKIKEAREVYIKIENTSKRLRMPESSDGQVKNSTAVSQLMDLRKIANHVCLATGIAYPEERLKEMAKILHRDDSHADADEKLILEDLKTLSDIQVHKVCEYYSCINSFALDMETIVNGSGKMKWLDENLPILFSKGHRVLLFSQFVLVLNVVEMFVKDRGFKYLRLDGGTSVSDRQELIDEFNNDESYQLFLLSTRAGGLGINLTSADTVIFHDIDFNPHNDKQAEDRCHRMGQTKQVQIIRLMSENTVESNMLRVAQEKLRLEENITNATSSSTSGTAKAGEKRKHSETKTQSTPSSTETKSNDENVAETLIREVTGV